MVMETGSILRPVSRASSPITSCRYSGIVKKTPIRIRFWLNRPIRPARSGAIFSSARCTSGSRPLLSRRPCHGVNAHSSARPAPTTKSVSEKPNGVSGESSLGLTQPQALDCSTPRTTSPRPVGGQDRADEVELRCRAGPHGVDHLRGHHQDQRDEHDLAREDDPPRVLRGRPAAQDRPHGDPGPGDPADHGVGHLARRHPRSCRRSGRPSRAGPARHRALRGSTSPGSARPPSAPAP